jgi:hypothetical protein
VRISTKTYKENNKEKATESQRQSVKKRSDHYREYKRQWRIANREHLRMLHHQHYIENKEKYLEQSKEWRITHPKERKQTVDRYRNNNTEKIRASGRAQSERARMELSDNYMKSLIVQKSDLPPSLVPDSLIEAKREHIRLKRKLKEIKEKA